MKNLFDETYNNLISEVLQNGVLKSDRTDTGTLSKFGCNMTFDISMYFPLLTNKRVFFKGVVEELLWMLRGDTNANKLSQKNVKIWDANGSKDFLNSWRFLKRVLMEMVFFFWFYAMAISISDGVFFVAVGNN